MEEIDAAHDIGDPLERVVDDDREMIAGPCVAPCEDDVAPALGIGVEAAALSLGARAALLEGQRPGGGDRRGHVEAQRIGVATRDAGLPLGGRERPFPTG